MTSEGPLVDEAYHPAFAYESFVVPRYARHFGEMLLRAIHLAEQPVVLDLVARTGYPGAELLSAIGNGQMMAIDTDPAFLELAVERAGSELNQRYFLQQQSAESLSFEAETFTNVIGNLIDRAITDRTALLSEASRVLRKHGQLVLTMPLRGSFTEVLDLLREVALKHDLDAVSKRLDQYEESLPTADQWLAEVDAHGFVHTQVQESSFSLQFESGAHLLTDPAVITAAMPEWQWCASAIQDPSSVLYGLQDAVDIYFRGRVFEVGVTAGCVTAWKF